MTPETYVPICTVITGLTVPLVVTARTMGPREICRVT
jgi:hypothetical protein